MFISTITSWDYGYQFFLLYWHVVVSKLKLSIFCERKTPRIRWMISFELGKEIEKDFFALSRAWDKEKNLSPHEESSLRPSDSALGCSTTEPQRLRWARNPKVWGSIPHGELKMFFFFPRSWQDEKHLTIFLYGAQKIPSLLFYLQTWRYRRCWSKQYAGRASYELRRLPSL